MGEVKLVFKAKQREANRSSGVSCAAFPSELYTCTKQHALFSALDVIIVGSFTH